VVYVPLCTDHCSHQTTTKLDLFVSPLVPSTHTLWERSRQVLERNDLEETESYLLHFVARFRYTYTFVWRVSSVKPVASETYPHLFRGDRATQKSSELDKLQFYRDDVKLWILAPETNSNWVILRVLKIYETHSRFQRNHIAAPVLDNGR
jgi:hypothetical protein